MKKAAIVLGFALSLALMAFGCGVFACSIWLDLRHEKACAERPRTWFDIKSIRIYAQTLDGGNEGVSILVVHPHVHQDQIWCELLDQ